MSCLDAESEGKWRGRGGVNELKQTELQKEILLLVDSPATVNDVGPEADHPPTPPPPPPPTSPWGPQGRRPSEDNTCPYFVYITLMLTCNLSAVAA